MRPPTFTRIVFLSNHSGRAIAVRREQLVRQRVAPEVVRERHAPGSRLRAQLVELGAPFAINLFSSSDITTPA
jgi:hypothetical protein